MDRRSFLAYSLASGVTVWAGSAIPSKFAELFHIGSTNAQAAQVFPQSVASGDPQPQGITLWTRVATTVPTATLSFQIATDRDFRNIVLSGVAATDAERDYTVKVSLDNRAELKPATTYFYRFIFENTPSRTGRFKTLPAPDAKVDRVRFAYVSCSDYTNGLFTAFRYLAEEDIDFVIHLGDAIYETVFDPTFQNNVRPIRLPSGAPTAESLEDYRALYKIYRSDPDLQRVHESHAFIFIWDDHEFANDAHQTFNTDNPDPAKPELSNTPRRRQIASRVWAEYTPTSIVFDGTRPPLEAIQLYRTVVCGDLMELILTDERLYRDPHACGPTTAQRSLNPGCPNLANPDRSMLGKTQRDWFLGKVTNSTRTWKIWGNEVMTMQLKIAKAVVDRVRPGLIPVDLFAYLDQWDGYPVERALIFRTIRDRGVKNFVTVTGDLHSFVAGYQRLDFNTPFNPGTVPPDAVGVEFVCGSISASNLAEQPNPFQLDVQTSTQLLLASNPHILFFNSATHGYNLIEVTPTLLTCRMKAVSNITSPNAALSTLKVYEVPKDQVLIRDVTSR
ncbi:MAG: alkaline phosphatase D family protein [Pseudanabaenaceae cyanobacterium SKYGB_i_bin29]|nr:alkaline phosphatase D family protein [Pseudanabaenaceae cyanobacterium SKYG29]MDW8421911.1 alkaline phosphatase D family protein [Pseudanabaenaceae cyanobacterium SKYGB_i_bin29]